MAYRLEFAPRVNRAFRKLTRMMQARLAGAIETLAENPRPHGVKKMAGEENLYRIRVGDYRVVYQILDEELRVVIVKIGRRREVYRG